MATWAGRERQYFAETDSTNRQARQAAANGATFGAVFVAGSQTGGRGRRGRPWESQPGMSLLLSIVLRADTANRPLLSFAVALAAADACEAACGEKAMIKWPNDIVMNGKKVAGILLENEGGTVAAGIGINVRQTENDFPEAFREKAASLESQSGRLVSMEKLEAALLDAIEKYVDGGDCLAAYRSRCVTLGAKVRVFPAGESFLGVAVDLDSSGALLVRDTEGVLRTVFAGDVSVRGENGYV